LVSHGNIIQALYKQLADRSMGPFEVPRLALPSTMEDMDTTLSPERRLVMTPPRAALSTSGPCLVAAADIVGPTLVVLEEESVVGLSTPETLVTPPRVKPTMKPGPRCVSAVKNNASSVVASAGTTIRRPVTNPIAEPKTADSMDVEMGSTPDKLLLVTPPKVKPTVKTGPRRISAANEAKKTDAMDVATPDKLLLVTPPRAKPSVNSEPRRMPAAKEVVLSVVASAGASLDHPSPKPTAKPKATEVMDVEMGSTPAVVSVPPLSVVSVPSVAVVAASVLNTTPKPSLALIAAMHAAAISATTSARPMSLLYPDRPPSTKEEMAARTIKAPRSRKAKQ
jgi:hypothetical protein